MTTNIERTTADHGGAGPAPTVLTADQISQVPKQPLGTIAGVENQVLWKSETSMAGVLTVAAGHRLGKHTHRDNHHHFWVLAGSAVVMGQEVGVGSYVHIPSGVMHDIDATSSAGCSVYYLYLPPGG